VYVGQINLKPATIQMEQMGIPSSNIDAAKAKLLQSLQERYPNLNPDEVILRSFKRVDWSDTSLGCPKADESYAQVVTPGYQLRFQIGDDYFEVHTDVDGNIVVVPPDFRICDVETQRQ
jgi:Iap family predicted aminopeptidase